MRIGTNTMALFAYRQMGIHQNQMMTAMMRLSSGKRINSAKDDPAGLAISERMRAQIRGLNQAARNAQDGVSLIQTAEGGLNESHAILQRMRELTVQAGNDTLTGSDRLKLQDEFDELINGLNDIGKSTEFNTQSLLDDSFKDKKLQIGANSGQFMEISINDMTSDSLSLTDLSLSSHEEAGETLSVLDTAIESVSRERSRLGAMENRLGHTISNLDNQAFNLTNAESRIRDADMAKEMMNMVKHNILNQAAQMMLVMSMSQPQSILQLLNS
ncbi:flagellin [Halolactibacillus halophilus]|uniref:Flagellin n=1 Tax=Halolactibacillus halophilus TaxID=306540 RepID=A0A1I5QA30_9BACI|nr:flagellin [Halolactibacillus halophilus]GEM01712.1 flagellin [Halolactibacillus halophilus]SFP43164.1 flagellin [Halolactibacillus halophilus]